MRLFRRKRRELPVAYEQLATYNWERLHGILHDPKWIAYMADVQERYNREYGVDGLVVRPQSEEPPG
jgi:hypothetical protein